MFFVLPIGLWKIVKSAISKLIIPFNSGGFTYESLVCASHMFNMKPSLKDVWCFVISLLAVRSPLISPTNNYFNLPSINLTFTKLISRHRNAAAVDFWRSSHSEDGTLLPPKSLSSSSVYNILVGDVYLDDSVIHGNEKISRYLLTSGFTPTSPPLSSITPNLISVKNVPFYFLFHHFSILNNSLPTSRRLRHQQHVSADNVKQCFFCGLEYTTHLLCLCRCVQCALFLSQRLKLSVTPFARISSPSSSTPFSPPSFSSRLRSFISSVCPTLSSSPPLAPSNLVPHLLPPS